MFTDLRPKKGIWNRSCIEEVGVKSISPEIVKESNYSVWVNLRNYVLSESPKFISLGHLTIETADIRNIDFATSTRAKSLNRLRRDTERDDRLGYTHDFETMSKTTDYRNHIKNSELETREVFKRETWSPENIQRTPPTDIVTRLDNNKLPRSMDSSKHEETHKTEVNPDPEPSSSYSSETSSSDSIAKRKKRKKKKKRRKHRKYDSSDPSSSDDSDSSDGSHYRRKRHKKKKHWKRDLIKQFTILTEKLLTTAYKSNIIRLKMYEDPLQRRIYFLTFVESLDVIFSQYTETCEVLLDYPKIGGDDVIEYYEDRCVLFFTHNQ